MTAIPPQATSLTPGTPLPLGPQVVPSGGLTFGPYDVSGAGGFAFDYSPAAISEAPHTLVIASSDGRYVATHVIAGGVRRPSRGPALVSMGNDPLSGAPITHAPGVTVTVTLLPTGAAFSLSAASVTALVAAATGPLGHHSIAVLQHTMTSNSTGSGVGSLSLQFGSNTTASAVYDVGGGWGNLTGVQHNPVTSDNEGGGGGNTYGTLLAVWNAASEQGAYYNHTYGVAGGTKPTVTVTANALDVAGISFVSLYIAEVGGVLASGDPLDQTGTVGPTATQSFAVATTGSVASGELVIAYCEVLAGPYTNLSNPSSGWTPLDAGSSAAILDTDCYQVTSGSGVVTATFTSTDVTDTMGGIIRSYQPAVAGGAVFGAYYQHYYRSVVSQ